VKNLSFKHHSELESGLRKMLHRIKNSYFLSIFSEKEPFEILGVRTEWAFNDTWHISPKSSSHQFINTPRGRQKKYADLINIDVSGRIDLILVVKNTSGVIFLIPIDIKTDGWTVPSLRKSLEKTLGEKTFTPITDIEKSLMNKHQLQLALYRHILHRYLKSRPSLETIQIHPGGLLLAVNGRFVSNNLEQAKYWDKKLHEEIQTQAVSELTYLNHFHTDSTNQYY